MNYVLLSILMDFLNNISVVPQGVTVSDVRREPSFCKEVKIPILVVVGDMSGFASLRCSVSVSFPYRCSLKEIPNGGTP